MRIAVAGKGGMGKSVIAGTLARLAARRGEQVLALDSDPLPGLSLSLGSWPEPEEPLLLRAAVQDGQGRWGWADGVDAVTAVQRFATRAPDGVRLLQRGKVDGARRPITGATKAYWEVVHGIAGSPAFGDWTLIGDLPAGPHQTAEGWAPYAQTYVIVVTPGVQSALAARRIAALTGGRPVVYVANRVQDAREVRWLEDRLGAPVLESVPADPAVEAAERDGRAPIDHAPGSPAIAAITRLLDRLADRA
jgi:CO dehydrogenase maturation factor